MEVHRAEEADNRTCVALLLILHDLRGLLDQAGSGVTRGNPGYYCLLVGIADDMCSVIVIINQTSWVT